MKQYLDLLRKVMDEGQDSMDRTGTGARSIFDAQMIFDLNESFPLLTTKNVFFKGVVHELLWMLKGDTNIRYLKENGVNIWDSWCTPDGELKYVYPYQWRNFNGQGVDQITNVINSIKNDPYSRRHIVSAWNPAQTNEMALPPCHALFQFFVRDGYLSCKLYQRSADIFLGVPFNIASYSLLTKMIAQQCDLKPGKFIWVGGDTHAYFNHFGQIHEQLSREPKDPPQVWIDRRPPTIFDYKFEDFDLVGYDPHPAIKAPVAV